MVEDVIRVLELDNEALMPGFTTCLAAPWHGMAWHGMAWHGKIQEMQFVNKQKLITLHVELEGWPDPNEELPPLAEQSSLSRMLHWLDTEVTWLLRAAEIVSLGNWPSGGRPGAFKRLSEFAIS